MALPAGHGRGHEREGGAGLDELAHHGDETTFAAIGDLSTRASASDRQELRQPTALALVAATVTGRQSNTTSSPSSR